MKENWKPLLFLLCVCFVFAAAGVHARPFTVTLQLQHSHLAEIVFGCAAGATPGYDRDLDDFAPPPGIETGFTVFLPPDPSTRLPPFYKDIRGLETEVTWTVYSRVFTGKPVVFTWDATNLPATHDLTILLDDKLQNMHTSEKLELSETKTFTIKATRRMEKPAAKTE